MKVYVDIRKWSNGLWFTLMDYLDKLVCCGAIWEWMESFANFLKNPAAGFVLLTLSYDLQVILRCQILHTNFVKLTTHIYFWDCITEVEWYMLQRLENNLHSQLCHLHPSFSSSLLKWNLCPLKRQSRAKPGKALWIKVSYSNREGSILLRSAYNWQ